MNEKPGFRGVIRHGQICSEQDESGRQSIPQDIRLSPGSERCSDSPGDLLVLAARPLHTLRQGDEADDGDTHTGFDD